MLDYDGDHAITFDELVAGVKEIWTAGRALVGRGGQNEVGVIEKLLERIAGYLRSQRESAQDTFLRFDTNGNGKLEPRELARFMRACLPELASIEVRCVLPGNSSDRHLLRACRCQGTALLTYNSCAYSRSPPTSLHPGS